MKSSVLVTRAVLAEFARRIYIPVLIGIVVVSVVLIALSIWLTTMSAWWWILFAVVILWVILAAVALSIIWVILRVLDPVQKKQQKTAVKSFVDTLQNLSEITQTPKFILLFRVVRDLVSSRQEGFVKTTIGNTLSLRNDFQRLRTLFDE